LNFIAEMTEVEDLGDQPRDLSDSSYYLTRLLNSLMADLSLKTQRKKTKNFKLTSLMTPTEHTSLCEIITIIFEKAVNHKVLKANLKEFTERNKFDFYYRFLVYLHQTDEVLSFNRFCLALVSLLSGSHYLLPDIYRSLSVHLLAEVVRPSISPESKNQPNASQSPAIFSALSLCRLNKFFFYTSEQKKLFTDVLEQVFINKLAHYNTSLDKRLNTIDLRLLTLAGSITGLIIDFDKKELQNSDSAFQNADEIMRKPAKGSRSNSPGQGSSEEGSPRDNLEGSKEKKPKKSKKDLKIKQSDDEDEKEGGKAKAKKAKKDDDGDAGKKKDRNKSKDVKEKLKIEKSPDKKKTDKDKGKSPDKKVKKEDKDKSPDKKAKKDGKSPEKKTKKDEDKGKEKKKATATKNKKKDGKEGAEVGAYPLDSDEDPDAVANSGEEENEAEGSEDIKKSKNSNKTLSKSI
jgi:hypothetical protein